MQYEVEVQRTITTTVTVEAEDAGHAMKLVDNVSFPLPPAEEWDTLEGWTYLVTDPETGDPEEF